MAALPPQNEQFFARQFFIIGCIPVVQKKPFIPPRQRAKLCPKGDNVMPITTAVFDAYGTLFDVAAAARTAAAEPGRDGLAACWQKLATDWRLKQLQYTWLRAVSNAHADFWDVTQDGLDYALENNKLDGDAELRERLLGLYWELAAYPEVPAMLAALKDAGFNTAILSNGSPNMLNGAVQSAGIGDLLDDVLSVESVGVFKPHKTVYDLVGQRFGTTPDQVLFVSSNGWDAAAATGQGFYTTWVNRAGEPMDRLPWKPNQVLANLTTIPDIAKAH
jgi:2-haloacid dehalogenase